MKQGNYVKKSYPGDALNARGVLVRGRHGLVMVRSKGKLKLHFARAVMWL